MSILESSFNGTRLKAAREYNGMTISDVAQALNVSNQSISQFENNKTEPKQENVFRLSNLLGFPREYFYEKDNMEVSIGNTYFRSLTSTSKKERKAQVEKVRLLAKLYEGIQSYIKFPEFDLEPQDNANPEALAEYVRDKWKLGNKPIYNLIDVMEKHGVIISNAFEENSHIDAYSHVEVIGNQSVPIVVLGYETTLFRQQFNAAHELGHILTDGVYELDELSKAEYKDMEKFMNHFAGALLIPRDLLLQDLGGSGKTDVRYYIQLKKKYLVSAQALIVRANQIGAITTNQYQYLMKQISMNNFRKKEPLDDIYPLVFPRYLKHAMTLIKTKMKVSGDDFMCHLENQNLSLYKSMVEKLLNLEEGFLSDSTRLDDKIVLLTR